MSDDNKGRKDEGRFDGLFRGSVYDSMSGGAGGRQCNCVGVLSMVQILLN